MLALICITAAVGQCIEQSYYEISKLLLSVKAFNIERSGQCEQYESQHNKSERSTESLLEYHSTP